MGKLKQCKIIGGIQVGIYLLLITLTIMAMCGVFEKRCSTDKCKEANENLKAAGELKNHRKWTLRYSKLVIYFLKLGFAIFLIIAAKKRSCDYLLVYCVLSIEGKAPNISSFNFGIFHQFLTYLVTLFYRKLQFFKTSQN